MNPKPNEETNHQAAEDKAEESKPNLGNDTLSAETQAALNAAQEKEESPKAESAENARPASDNDSILKDSDMASMQDAIAAALNRGGKEENTESGNAAESKQDEEVAQLKDQLIRKAAEIENLRKRSERELADSRKYAVTGFARDMVNVVENLQLALQNIPEEARQQDDKLQTLAQGVEMTYNELLRIFGNHGITRIEPKGEKFNHNQHQAVAQVEDAEAEPGTIIQVLQSGYIIHDRLLRPAMVTVAKAAPKAAESVDTEA